MRWSMSDLSHRRKRHKFTRKVSQMSLTMNWRRQLRSKLIFSTNEKMQLESSTDTGSIRRPSSKRNEKLLKLSKQTNNLRSSKNWKKLRKRWRHVKKNNQRNKKRRWKRSLSQNTWVRWLNKTMPRRILSIQRLYAITYSLWSRQQTPCLCKLQEFWDQTWSRVPWTRDLYLTNRLLSAISAKLCWAQSILSRLNNSQEWLASSLS